MNKSFVFKVERGSLEFEAILSTGENVKLTILESSTNQIQEIERNKESLSSLEMTKKHLSENLKGERAQEFIDDLMENGSLADFYIRINEQFRALKGIKRKKESEYLYGKNRNHWGNGRRDCPFKRKDGDRSHSKKSLHGILSGNLERT